MLKPSLKFVWLFCLFSCEKIPASNNACVLAAGNIVLTEIFVDPLHDDTEPEWFEIYNPTDQRLSLSRLQLEVVGSSGTSRSHELKGDIFIEPQSYFVLGNKPATYINYTYENGLALPNSQAKLTLRCRDTIVDTVEYGTAALPIRAGFSLKRELPLQEATWCLTEEILYDAVNFGSPRLANSPCGIHMCHEENTLRNVVSLTTHAIVLSEIFSDPQGADQNKEWLELYNPSDVAVDLNDLTIKQRSPKNTERQWTLQSSACIQILPKNYTVLTIGEGQNLQGETLFNGEAIFELWQRGVLLDSLTIPEIPQGYAANVDAHWFSQPDFTQQRAVCTATQNYADQAFGTPGQINNECKKPCDLGRKLKSGDIRILEILADPQAADNDRDWFAIEITSRDLLDFSHLKLVNTNAKGNQRIFNITLAECASAPVFERLVIAGQNAVNDGVTTWLTFKGTAATLLYNEAATLAFMQDTTVIAAVSYPKPEENKIYFP